MKVAKWGNSLAVRLPVAIVDAMELKEGDEIDVQIAGHREFDIERRLQRTEALEKLRALLKDKLPPGFRFDRADIYED